MSGHAPDEVDEIDEVTRVVAGARLIAAAPLMLEALKEIAGRIALTRECAVPSASSLGIDIAAMEPRISAAIRAAEGGDEHGKQ